VRSDERVEVRVLANDHDPDGDLDPGTLRIVGPPASGEAKIHHDVEIRYDAPETSIGRQVVIRYRICDRAGHCSEANLRVTITPEN
jgi:hypothetical protein